MNFRYFGISLFFRHQKVGSGHESVIYGTVSSALTARFGRLPRSFANQRPLYSQSGVFDEFLTCAMKRRAMMIGSYAWLLTVIPA
uniref:Secreted protein n=1 Tax=Ascaris lumbricoides TaxID=6252 RepID=A0A0M3HFQ3_ASCLU